jgi:hypothetical protein
VICGAEKVGKGFLAYWKRSATPLPHVHKLAIVTTFTLLPYISCELLMHFLQGKTTFVENERRATLWDGPGITMFIHFLITLAELVGFFIWQWRLEAAIDQAEVGVDIAVTKAMKDSLLNFSGAMDSISERIRTGAMESATTTTRSSNMQSWMADLPVAATRTERRVRRILYPFYKSFNTSGQGLNRSQIETIFISMHEHPASGAVDELFHANCDDQGNVDFAGFCSMMIGSLAYPAAKPEAKHADDDDEDKVHIPNDLADLTPEQQQRRIKWRAFWLLTIGLIFSYAFSDPCVDCFNEIANRLHLPSFYVGFILSPLISDAPEMLSTFQFACGGTPESLSAAFATGTGSILQENTLVFMVFCFVIWFGRFSWRFLANIGGLIFCEVVCLSTVVLWRKCNMIQAWWSLLMYAGSLFVIWLLDKYVGENYP